MKIGKILVSYRTAGSGQPILILHGWNHSSERWRRVQELVASGEFQVIVPDLPGFGNTPAPNRAWGVGEYADFARAFCEALALRDFYLVGHSFGGKIAIRVAAETPHAVKGLILVAPAVMRQRKGFKTLLIISLAKIGKVMFSLPVFRGIREKMKDWFCSLFPKRDYAKASGIMRDILKNVTAEFMISDIETLASGGPETLLIWGDQDQSVPVQTGYALKKRWPRSTITILPGIGHSPNVTAPERLAERIARFARS